MRANVSSLLPSSARKLFVWGGHYVETKNPARHTAKRGQNSFRRCRFLPQDALKSSINVPVVHEVVTFDDEDAYAKICAGAALVQLYTALVFAGPSLVNQIKTGLADLLQRDGFTSMADAVGTAQSAASARRPGSLVVP